MTTESGLEKIPIAISSCLLGQEVRYDGGHKHNGYITETLGEYFEYTAFCPEVAVRQSSWCRWTGPFACVAAGTHNSM